MGIAGMNLTRRPAPSRLRAGRRRTAKGGVECPARNVSGRFNGGQMSDGQRLERSWRVIRKVIERGLCAGVVMVLAGGIAAGQGKAGWRDPVEPSQGAPKPKIAARPAGAVARDSTLRAGWRSLYADLARREFDSAVCAD